MEDLDIFIYSPHLQKHLKSVSGTVKLLLLSDKNNKTVKIFQYVNLLSGEVVDKRIRGEITANFDANPIIIYQTPPSPNFEATRST